MKTTEEQVKTVMQKMMNDAAKAISQYKCPICKKAVRGFRDELSQAEYQISGMCQNCQDDFFEEEDE